MPSTSSVTNKMMQNNSSENFKGQKPAQLNEVEQIDTKSRVSTQNKPRDDNLPVT